MGIGMIALICGSLCFCQKGEKDYMLEYMERKYQESFTTTESYAGQFGKDYTMIKVRSRRLEKSGILVRAVKEKERIVYQDNYLAYLLREQIEKRMAALAEPIFGECKVFYKIPEMVFPENFPPDMKADTFLRQPEAMVRIYFYVRVLSPDQEEKFGQLLEAFRREGFRIGGVISYPAEEKYYRMITGRNFTRDIYLGYQYLQEAVFSMDEKGELAYLEWKE